MTGLKHAAGYGVPGVFAICGLWLALLPTAGSVLSARPAGRPLVVQTDVCTLSGSPRALRGKIVRVRAQIIVVVEGAFLSQKSWKCTVGFWTPRAVEDDPNIKTATAEARGTSGDVVGTITGVFSVKRVRHRSIPVIETIKITDLRVKPLTPCGPQSGRTETDASTTQSCVNRALGTRSAYGIWDPTWNPALVEPLSKAAIKSQAQIAATCDYDPNNCR